MSILVGVGLHLLRGSRRDAVGHLDADARAAKPRAAEELAGRKLQRPGALGHPLRSHTGTFAQIRGPQEQRSVSGRSRQHPELSAPNMVKRVVDMISLTYR